MKPNNVQSTEDLTHDPTKHSTLKREQNRTQNQAKQPKRGPPRRIPKNPAHKPHKLKWAYTRVFKKKVRWGRQARARERSSTKRIGLWKLGKSKCTGICTDLSSELAKGGVCVCTQNSNWSLRPYFARASSSSSSSSSSSAIVSPHGFRPGFTAWLSSRFRCATFIRCAELGLRDLWMVPVPRWQATHLAWTQFLAIQWHPRSVLDPFIGPLLLIFIHIIFFCVYELYLCSICMCHQVNCYISSTFCFVNRIGKR